MPGDTTKLGGLYSPSLFLVNEVPSAFDYFNIVFLYASPLEVLINDFVLIRRFLYFLLRMYVVVLLLLGEFFVFIEEAMNFFQYLGWT